MKTKVRRPTKLPPKDLYLKQQGSVYSIGVFPEDGGVRIENLGPFNRAEVKRLCKWLTRWLAAQR